MGIGRVEVLCGNVLYFKVEIVSKDVQLYWQCLILYNIREILETWILILTYLIHVIIILFTKKLMVSPHMITCYDRL